MGFNVYLEGQTGRAYTPLDPLTLVNGEPYSRNAPFQSTTDLRINRTFPAGAHRLDLSLSGLNIFNTHVIYRVDPVTGLGRVWGQGSYDPRLFPLLRIPATAEYTRVSQVDDPSNYGPGVQWRLQLDYDF
jgi:hypothetical protein